MTPNVPVGSKLKFRVELEENNAWPPTKIKRHHGDGATATPYLVVAADAHDTGKRPIPGAEALDNASVEIVEPATGNLVTNPAPGVSYTLRVRILNLGANASYSGIAEFAVADPAAIDLAARGAAMLPVFAVEGFTVLPQATVVVTCSRLWTPADVTAASASVVVNV